MTRKRFVLILIVTLASCKTGKQTTSMIEKNQFETQGHRGSRGLMPENTIPAMLKAIDLGVTTLEMDVVISKDDKVVVSHDLYFNEKITTAPSGKYLTKAESTALLIYQMPYDQIKKYDVGLKPHPDFPRQQKIAAYKPLLSELIDSSEAYNRLKGKKLLYNIEIKSQPKGDGTKHPMIDVFADLVMNVITEKGIAARTTIQSFDMRGLQAVHKKHPEMVTSLLIEDTDKTTLDEQLQKLGYTPSVYSPHFSLVTPALLEQCHKMNIRVIPWTVNTIEEMKRLKQLGVDGIISDYPDLFSQL